jgi:hypothetical protein
MDNKNFYYNRVNVIMNFGLFPALLLFILLFAMIVGKDMIAPLLSGSICVIFFGLIGIIVLFITNLLKTQIILNSTGIEYKSLFKNVRTGWSEVIDIQRKYIYSGGFPTGGPPRDLQVTSSNKKHINILYFVLNVDNKNWDEDGLPELEAEIKKYCKIEF